MMIIDNLTNNFNQSTTAASQAVNKIATNPSATKKLLQIISKAIAGYDLYTGATHCPELLRTAAGAIELIEFYGTFKNIIFWINPFSKESIDQEALTASLQESVEEFRTPAQGEVSNADLVNKVYAQVMNHKAYHHQQEVAEALKSALSVQGCEGDLIENILKNVAVQQKSRPIALLISSACFTTVDAIGSALALQKWGIVNLSNLATQIGAKSPVFASMTKAGLGTIISPLVCTGLAVTFGSNVQKFANAYWNYTNAGEGKEKENYYQTLRSSRLEMLGSGLDFVAAAAPYVFAVTPAGMIGLSLLAKSTGLVIILVK